MFWSNAQVGRWEEGGMEACKGGTVPIGSCDLSLERDYFSFLLSTQNVVQLDVFIFPTNDPT
jgi:hypothetical protein